MQRHRDESPLRKHQVVGHIWKPAQESKRSRADLNRDRWIQSPECYPLHHGTKLAFIYKRCRTYTTSATDCVAPAADHSPTGVGLTTTGCQSGMDPRMGVKPGVGMHQIGMRNAPQAGMAGICLGHGHGGNDNVMTVASQAGFSLQTPESACACRFVSTGSVLSFRFSICGI